MKIPPNTDSTAMPLIFACPDSVPVYTIVNSVCSERNHQLAYLIAIPSHDTLYVPLSPHLSSEVVDMPQRLQLFLQTSPSQEIDIPQFRAAANGVVHKQSEVRSDSSPAQKR